MVIGQRIKVLRQQKEISQGGIQKSTGLLRGYVSRVEHGLTLPSLETLMRFAHALDVPLYLLFYGAADATETPHPASGPPLSELGDDAGPAETEARPLQELKRLAGSLRYADRLLLLRLARTLASASHASTHAPSGETSV